MGNAFGGLFQGLTAGKFNSSPVGGETAKYYKQLTRMSNALAMSADISMLMLGGDLKRKEMLSARLGDVLSHLYIASSVLKFYEDNGRQVADLPFVHYSVQRNLHEISRAFSGFFSNFPNGAVGSLLKGMLFPFGLNFPMPSDDISMQISDALLKPSVIRDRLNTLVLHR